jgi:hypothetical protein
MAYKCLVCKYDTIYSTHYRKHLSSAKHEKNSIKDMKEYNKKIINENINLEKKEKLSECKYCGLEINDKSNLLRHTKNCILSKLKDLNIPIAIIKTKLNNLECPICNHKTTRKASIMQHISHCNINENKALKKLENIPNINNIILEYENKLLQEQLKHKDELIKEQLKHKDELIKEKTKQFDEMNILLNKINGETKTLANELVNTNIKNMIFLNKFISNEE